MASLTPTPKQQIYGSDGNPLVGGKIYTYSAGTTTPLATYTDAGAGTANTNPIILNSLGQANIWLGSSSYKFSVYTAADVLLYTVDNINAPLDATGLATALSSPTPIGNTTPNTGAFTTLAATTGNITTVNATTVNAATITATGTVTAETLTFEGGGSITKPFEEAVQPITATVASNQLTVTLNPTTLDFRSATLGSGTVSSINLASAASIVVPATATLGTVSAVQGTIVVVAINNAGTIELAVVNIAGGRDLSESGLISTTAISVAATSDSVFYSTTARTNVAYRVVGFINITEATAGTWATAPSTVQGAGGNNVISSASYIRLTQYNGFGSTNTCIGRFSVINVSQGTDITYADSATLGGLFTINTTGVYAITITGGGNVNMGISVNSTELSTSINTISVANRVASNGGNASLAQCASWTGYLVAGSLVRPHTDGSNFSSITPSFTIVKVA